MKIRGHDLTIGAPSFNGDGCVRAPAVQLWGESLPLPRGEGPRMTERSKAHPARPVTVPGTDPVVLVVEDEALLRAMIRRLLEREGYSVLEAENGADALRLLEGSAGRTVESGAHRCAHARDGRPGAGRGPGPHPARIAGGPHVRIHCPTEGDPAHQPHLALLFKPFQEADLLKTIRTHLDRASRGLRGLTNPSAITIFGSSRASRQRDGVSLTAIPRDLHRTSRYS